jgi:hypothetical protein
MYRREHRHQLSFEFFFLSFGAEHGSALKLDQLLAVTHEFRD